MCMVYVKQYMKIQNISVLTGFTETETNLNVGLG